MYIEGEREAKIQALFVFVMPHTQTHLHGTYIHHRTARGGRKNYHHSQHGFSMWVTKPEAMYQVINGKDLRWGIPNGDWMYNNFKNWLFVWQVKKFIADIHCIEEVDGAIDFKYHEYAWKHRNMYLMHVQVRFNRALSVNVKGRLHSKWNLWLRFTYQEKSLPSLTIFTPSDQT